MAVKSQSDHRLLVGVPWRTAREEAAGNREKLEPYLRAVEVAGAAAVAVTLQLDRAQLEKLADTLDAVVLPGSPADVDPSRYGAQRRRECAEPDLQREKTDACLLDYAFSERKPVLAICYGLQSLNVYLGGKLIQDIAAEVGTKIRHERDKRPRAKDQEHLVRIEPGSRLASLAVSVEARVNSSHHQAILEPGRNLRVTARAPDGIVEAVEVSPGDHWVTGVQWHPERMGADPLARALFEHLVVAARHSLSAAADTV